jgi:hypothetical protein
MTDRLLLYTAIFGTRDIVRKPLKSPGATWACITDNSDAFGIEGVIPSYMPCPGDPVRSARLVKAMPHLFFPNYDRWIWIDGSITVNDDLEFLPLDDICGELAAFQHPAHKSVYDEATACVRFFKDNPHVILAQMMEYKDESFPDDQPICETGVVCRRNTFRVREFNRYWWGKISTRSRRDQLSFTWSAWKTGLQITLLPGSVHRNRWFRLNHHADEVR